jgi:hypothetical protein
MQLPAQATKRKDFMIYVGNRFRNVENHFQYIVFKMLEPRKNPKMLVYEHIQKSLCIFVHEYKLC